VLQRKSENKNSRTNKILFISSKKAYRHMDTTKRGKKLMMGSTSGQPKERPQRHL